MAHPVKLTLPLPCPAGELARPLAVVRDLLGGALVLAVWLSLWSWVAIGVVGPLSQAAAASAIAQRRRCERGGDRSRVRRGPTRPDSVRRPARRVRRDLPPGTSSRARARSLPGWCPP